MKIIFKFYFSRYIQIRYWILRIEPETNESVSSGIIYKKGELSILNIYMHISMYIPMSHGNKISKMIFYNSILFKKYYIKKNYIILPNTSMRIVSCSSSSSFFVELSFNLPDITKA